jgi:hypothetical protein
MTATKNLMKSHLEDGLDITSQVTWVNHLGQEVPATVSLNGRIWAIRSAQDNSILQSGGHGAQFTFAY